jgi:hypothetical protein
MAPKTHTFLAADEWNTNWTELPSSKYEEDDFPVVRFASNRSLEILCSDALLGLQSENDLQKN